MWSILILTVSILILTVSILILTVSNLILTIVTWFQKKTGTRGSTPVPSRREWPVSPAVRFQKNGKHIIFYQHEEFHQKLFYFSSTMLPRFHFGKIRHEKYTKSLYTQLETWSAIILVFDVFILELLIFGISGFKKN